MTGPFTTITVAQYYQMQDALRAADALAETVAQLPIRVDEPYHSVHVAYDAYVKVRAK